MAVIKVKRKTGTRYQARIRGSDGKWISRLFDRKADAREFEEELKRRMRKGDYISNFAHKITVREFHKKWFEVTKGDASEGWRHTQLQMYRDYIDPVIGGLRLSSVSPVEIANTLNFVRRCGRKEQTLLHVFNLLRKVFSDAEELFELTDRNPVRKKFRPRLSVKETPHLSVQQLRDLLAYVEGRNFEVAIWLNVAAGLRVGEIQALRWNNVDLERRLIHVRENFVRREGRIKPYPKGRKWHSVPILPELAAKLRKVREANSKGFVVRSPRNKMLSYQGYYHALKRYCREAGIHEIATHGLRHSASELYMASGATRDDIRVLFGHSDSRVTDRYIHDKGERLEKVAKVVRLFPESENLTDSPCSINVPRREFSKLDQNGSTC